MKSNYFLYVELVSSSKFPKSGIDELQSKLDSDDHFLPFSDAFNSSIDHNFNNHIEIYVEDFPFEIDLYEEIEKIIKIIEDMVPGGWANDSKIEWISESPKSTTVWYKDSNEWKKVMRSNGRDPAGSDWDPFEEIEPTEGLEDGYYDNFDEDY